jgi:hypothetical protein
MADAIQKRSIFPYVATGVTIHPGRGAQSFSIWFETSRGPVVVELPSELAHELAAGLVVGLHPDAVENNQG